MGGAGWGGHTSPHSCPTAKQNKMSQQFGFDPSMQGHSHSYNPMAQSFDPSADRGMEFTAPPDFGASINASGGIEQYWQWDPSAFVPQYDPTNSGASATVSEDGQTEDCASAKGKETATRTTRCKHKAVAERNYTAAVQYKAMYNLAASELHNTQQNLSGVSQMARDMEALRQGQQQIMDGVAMIGSTLMPAFLSGQRGTEQSAHKGSHQTNASVSDRAEKEAATQLLLQDLLSVKSDLEGGNLEEGLKKVKDMISYFVRCTTIRDHARSLTERPGDWLIDQKDPSLQH